MKKKAGKPGPAAAGDPQFESLARIFADEKRVTAGKLFASMGLKVGGKIFAMVVLGRLVVKLPKDRVDVLVENGSGERFDPGHGRLMKEWFVLTATKPSAASLAREAFNFVGGL